MRKKLYDIKNSLTERLKEYEDKIKTLNETINEITLQKENNMNEINYLKDEIFKVKNICVDQFLDNISKNTNIGFEKLYEELTNFNDIKNENIEKILEKKYIYDIKCIAYEKCNGGNLLKYLDFF